MIVSGNALSVQPEPDFSKCNVKFSAPNTFTIFVIGNVKLWDGTIEYSTDRINWTEWDGTTELTAGLLGEKYVLFFRGIGNTQVTGPTVQTNNGAWHFTGDNISVSGTIKDLLDYSKEPTVGEAAYRSLFGAKDPGHTNLVDASGLIISGPMSLNCCNGMFSRCKGLLYPPKILVCDLAEKCFSAMFYQCTALNTLPIINATTFGNTNCSSMFAGCSSIMISSTQTGAYVNKYRIPYSESVTGTTGTDSFIYMFNSTGGTFATTAVINTVYYTSNNIDV